MDPFRKAQSIRLAQKDFFKYLCINPREHTCQPHSDRTDTDLAEQKGEKTNQQNKYIKMAYPQQERKIHTISWLQDIENEVSFQARIKPLKGCICYIVYITMSEIYLKIQFTMQGTAEYREQACWNQEVTFKSLVWSSLSLRVCGHGELKNLLINTQQKSVIYSCCVFHFLLDEFHSVGPVHILATQHIFPMKYALEMCPFFMQHCFQIHVRKK